MAGNIVLKKFKGVNVDLDPRDLDDFEFMRARNIFELTPGVLSARPSTQSLLTMTSYLTAPGVGAPFTEIPMSFSSFQVGFGLPGVVLAMQSLAPAGVSAAGGYLLPYNGYSTTLGAVFADGTQARIPAGPSPSMVAYQGKIYAFDGSIYSGLALSLTPPGPIVGQLPSLNAAMIGWPAADQPKPRIAFLYRDQLLLAGFQGADASLVRMCDPGDPTSLVAVSKAFTVGQGDGDKIMGGVEIVVEGGATYFEPYAILFKRNSSWLIQGRPPTSAANDTGSLLVSPLLRGEGLVSKNTIAYTPHGVVWCSGRNVWLTPPGQKPIAIGNNLRRMLKTRPQDETAGWCGVYFDGYYRLSVPKPDASSGISQLEQYWCDLRRFAPAQNDSTEMDIAWWGPMDLPISASYVDMTDPNNPQLLNAYSQQQTFGGISRLTTVLTLGDQWVSTDADKTSPPPYELWMKEFDFGDGFLMKLLDAVEVSASGDGTLDVQVNADGGLVKMDSGGQTL